MRTKKLLIGCSKSLTIWINSIMLAALPTIELIKDSLPQLHEYLTPETYKIVGLTVVVANIVLRFKTTTPLEDK